MTKNEFLKMYEEILKTRKGTKQEQGILGSADDRKKCNFTGVYAIFNNDVLVYVGSGYTPITHDVNARLNQYVSKGDNGNTLLKKVLADGLALDEDSAIKLIKTFEFISFEHNDLENELIGQTQLDWNIKGKKQ
ncbi:MAG: GIY-YIG nuclease family protein [Firmicutes bacterium]|nr:GIY-YIG nuclease family protein [Bacillota bacterium]